MFEIEKNVPIPSQINGKQIYPFDKMEIGDSFVFEKEFMNKVHYAKSQYGRRNEKKFALRRISDGRYRCWRIE